MSSKSARKDKVQAVIDALLQLKVGSRVRIKNVPMKDGHKEPVFMPSMLKYIGRVGVVTGMERGKRTAILFRVKVRGYEYYYRREWLEVI